MRRFHGSFSGHEPNHFFLNRGEGRSFLEAGSVLGLAQRTDGRATAPMDLDGDGSLDLVVQSLQDLKVFRNQLQTSNAYVQLSLQDDRGRPAIGAEVRLTTELGTVVDRVRLTAGFHTQVAPRVHLGLSAATQIKSVVIRWPSGRRSQVSGVVPNGHFLVREHKREATAQPRPVWPSESLPRPPAAIDWSQTVQTLDGQSVPLVTGKAITVVNLWAPWCTACKTESPILEALHQEKGSDIDIFGLVVEPKGLESVRSFIAKASLTYPQRFAPRPLIAALFGDEVRLPTTLIFDAAGQLVRRFGRMVEADELRQVLAALEVESTVADHLHQAEIDNDLKDYTEAYNHLLEAEKKAPTRVDIVRQIDTTARNSGNSLAALRALSRLTELEPTVADGWKRLSDLTLTLKGPGEALAALKPAPALPEVAIERARMRRQLKAPHEAIKLLRAARRAHPKHQGVKDALKRHLETVEH